MRSLAAVLLLAGCETLGPFAAKFVPALEFMNEEWAPLTVDCDPAFSSRRPSGCVTRTLRCGDTVKGNNKMGRSDWSDEFYRRATCMAVSSPGGHPGPEMVYKFVVPKQTNATAKLVSDCGDLDVFALRWGDRDLECPKLAHAQRIGECQSDLTPRGGSATMSATNREVAYLISVDGKGGVYGNYELTIECANF